MKKTVSNNELDTVVSYMTISIGWDFNIVLPYKDGVAFMATLEKAESIDRYNNKNLIFVDDKKDLVINTVTQKDYRESKMIKLLGVQDDDQSNTG